MNLNKIKFEKLYWKDNTLYVTTDVLDEDVDVGFVAELTDVGGRWRGRWYFNGEKSMYDLMFDTKSGAMRWVKNNIIKKIK